MLLLWQQSSICPNGLDKGLMTSFPPITASTESEQPVRSWSRSCVVWDWWAGRRRGSLDSPGSRATLEHHQEPPQETLQEMLQCYGEVRRAPETGSGSLLGEEEVGRGLLEMWVRLCGVKKTMIMATTTLMKKFLESGEHQATQRRWWVS